MNHLRIHDSDLELINSEGEVLAASPGFVNLAGDKPVFGDPARRRARVNPTRTENEFWDRFGMSELKVRSRAARYHADLAYHHLAHLWEEVGRPAVPLVVIVPSDFSREQIALLLGMTARLEMPVAAVIDLSLIAPSRPRQERIGVLDIHWHRTVVSVLDQGERLTVADRTAARAVSLSRLFDAWADRVAQTFIARTRFDPLHDATLEQSVHQQLRDWLDDAAGGDELTMILEHGDRRFEARITAAHLTEAAEPLYRRLVDLIDQRFPGDETVRLLLAERLTSLPGLVSALERDFRIRVHSWATSDLTRSVAELSIADDTSSADVAMIGFRPWAARATAQDDRPTATHYVVDHVAMPLGTDALAAKGRAGDKVRIDGQRATLITVRGGAPDA